MISALLNSPEHLKNLPGFSQWSTHLTCHLKLKMKSKTECCFLMYRLFMNTVNLPLCAFAMLFAISLALFKHSFIDASELAQVGLNCPPS